MSHDAPTPTIHGLMAEFENPKALVHAAEKARLAGYKHMDAYTPIPVEELDEALGLRRTRLPILVFLGGVFGGFAGFGLEYWTQVIAYPMNIGARPYNSWPQFIPVIFELTILFASLSAVIGMIVLNGLPQPYHPVFNVPRFEHASRDKFFLVIESTDPKFDRAKTLDFLKTLDASEINEVEP